LFIILYRNVFLLSSILPRARTPTAWSLLTTPMYSKLDITVLKLFRHFLVSLLSLRVMSHATFPIGVLEFSSFSLIENFNSCNTFDEDDFSLSLSLSLSLLDDVRVVQSTWRVATRRRGFSTEFPAPASMCVTLDILSSTQDIQGALPHSRFFLPPPPSLEQFSQLFQFVLPCYDFPSVFFCNMSLPV